MSHCSESAVLDRRPELNRAVRISGICRLRPGAVHRPAAAKKSQSSMTKEETKWDGGWDNNLSAANEGERQADKAAEGAREERADEGFSGRGWWRRQVAAPGGGGVECPARHRLGHQANQEGLDPIHSIAKCPAERRGDGRERGERGPTGGFKWSNGIHVKSAGH